MIMKHNAHEKREKEKKKIKKTPPITTLLIPSKNLLKFILEPLCKYTKKKERKQPKKSGK